MSDQYPTEILTIGDHLRKRRLDKKLLQKEVAEIIGVSTSSILNWELNRLQPTFWHYPKIIEFLGYLPFEMPSTTGEKIALYRKCKGLSHNQFAHQLGIDPSTLSKWQRGRGNLLKELLKKMEEFFASIINESFKHG